MLLRRLIRNCFNMTFNRFVNDRKPIVVVLGATGTGKSKLALEIARKYNGEIISADSMQVYKGLDIITNKVTPEEQQQAPHHLLDFVDPLQDFHIQQFQNLAVSVIEQLHQKSKLPVLVGGTHYYIESVLWKVLVIKETKQAASTSTPQSTLGSANSPSLGGNAFSQIFCNSSEGTSKNVKSNPSQINSYGDASDSNHSVDKNSFNNICEMSSEKNSLFNCEGEKMHTTPVSVAGIYNKAFNDKDNLKRTMDSQPLQYCTRNIPDATEDLYEKLCVIDPDRAKTLHPKDRRKIIRSLQIWQETGEMHSVHLRRQQEEAGGSVLGGGLRYPNTVVFWLHSDQAVLDPRLDARVDVMLQTGLLDELLDFHEHYNKTRLMQGAGCADALGKASCTPESVKSEQGVSSVTGVIPTGCCNPIDLLPPGTRTIQTSGVTLTGSSSTSCSRDAVSNVKDKDSETSKSSFADKNTFKNVERNTSPAKPCSSEKDNVRAGQKHLAPSEEVRCSKRLKVSSDSYKYSAAGTGSVPTSTTTERDTEPVHSSIMDKDVSKSVEDNMKQCHEGSIQRTTSQMVQGDYSQGIFQSIGFKEFHEYLVLPPEEKTTERGKKLRQNGLDLMKLATRRYARRQVKWIRNRFTKDLARQVPPIYRLDVTNPDDWETAVSVPANAVVAALVAGDAPPHHIVKPVERIPAPSSEIQGRFDRHECTLCSRVFIGHLQWRAHMRGAKHKKAKLRAARLKEEEVAAAAARGEASSVVEEERKPDEEREVLMSLEENQNNEDSSKKVMQQQQS